MQPTSRVHRGDRPVAAAARPRRGQRLLAVFELEKAVYELRYELDNRPDWVKIPVAGIARLLAEPEPTRPSGTDAPRRRRSPERRPDVTAEQERSVGRRELADPHALLGAHPRTEAARSSAPGARAPRARPRRRRRHGTARAGPPGGVWGAPRRADAAVAVPVETRYPDGVSVNDPDPSPFPPTVGELDLHLAGEGRHEEIYEHLGGHLARVDGVAGTAFAVWAPSARAVAVVGDFNAWDGRLHPMRSLGSSGIWELFLPGVEAGALYKFETQDPGRRAARQDRPVRAGGRDLAQDGGDRVDVAARVGRRRVGRASAASQVQHERPISIYEVHLGSWRRDPDDPSGCSTTPRSPTSWRPTRPTWASRTSSCCRSWRTRSRAPGATR